MTTFLIAALAVTTLLCLLLGMAFYRSWTAGNASYKHYESQHKEWMEEREHITRYLHGVTRVLNTHVGGISKRLSESAEIAEAIQRRSPELFKQCDGLAYWLHANDQFLNALYSVAAEAIDKDHRRRIHYMRKEGRGEVFKRIYEGAELPLPPVPLRGWE